MFWLKKCKLKWLKPEWWMVRQKKIEKFQNKWYATLWNNANSLSLFPRTPIKTNWMDDFFPFLPILQNTRCIKVSGYFQKNFANHINLRANIIYWIITFPRSEWTIRQRIIIITNQLATFHYRTDNIINVIVSSYWQQ